MEFYPAPPAAPRTDHSHFAAELKRHPGEWAPVPRTYSSDSARSMAYWISSGGGVFAPRGAFKAVSRADGDDHRVWVSYVGSVKKTA